MPSTMSEYRKKMQRIFDHLGGRCRICGAATQLQVDHVDHLNKSFTIANNWGLSWDKLIVELDKCQLLCKVCHLVKSKDEGSLAKGWTSQPHWRHGTVTGYSKWKCRCVDCRKAKSIAMAKEYKRKTGRGVAG